MTDALPKVSVQSVLTLRTKLEHRLRPHLGRRLAQDELEMFVDSLRFVFDPPIARGVVLSSVQHLLAKKITKDSLRQLCWRLAANVQQLRAGDPVYPWLRQDKEEWIAIQLKGCQLYRHPKFHDIRYRFSFVALTGTPAGNTASHIWTYKQCSYLATKIGFTKVSGRMPYQSPEQFVNFRLLARFSPESCSRGYLDFNEVACPSSLIGWNKTLLRARYKIDPPCPRDYQHDCHHCVIGYEECPAAVHAKTFTMQVCEKCGEMQLHDPDDKFLLCLECRRKHQLRRTE